MFTLRWTLAKAAFDDVAWGLGRSLYPRSQPWWHSNSCLCLWFLAVLIKLTDEHVLHRFVCLGRHFEDSAHLVLPEGGLLCFDQVRPFVLFPSSFYAKLSSLIIWHRNTESIAKPAVLFLIWNTAKKTKKQKLVTFPNVMCAYLFRQGSGMFYSSEPVIHLAQILTKPLRGKLAQDWISVLLLNRLVGMNEWVRLSFH